MSRPDADTVLQSGKPGMATPGDEGGAARREFPVDDLRYRRLEVLGEGGMGEVVLCDDTRIGRKVALKVARAAFADDEGARRRFVHEAQIQGRLEHPSVVPVHDLAESTLGTPYFTMKRVRGVTLDAIIGRLRAGDEETRGRFSQRRLLGAFVQVCLAVDFAHARGVLHRDLKPANVMLGDFGEVYVLDWGIAKVRETLDEDAPSGAFVAAADEAAPVTLSGDVLGTPGYMSPEQAVHEEAGLDGRSDVYALGVVLYEILALEPLCRATGAVQRIGETLAGVDARVCSRVPERDVAPELEAICLRATARHREDRYVSARELGEAVERYLDGDRDLAVRRSMADTQSAAAQGACARALADAGNFAARAEALQEIGRALALDPQNEATHEALARLANAPLRALPPELHDLLDHEARDRQRGAERMHALGGVAVLAILPAAHWMGVLHPGALWFTAGCWALNSALALVRMRNPPKRLDPLAVFVTSLAMASLCVAFGALVVVPTLLCGGAMAVALHPDRVRRAGRAALGRALPARCDDGVARVRQRRRDRPARAHRGAFPHGAERGRGTPGHRGLAAPAARGGVADDGGRHGAGACSTRGGRGV